MKGVGDVDDFSVRTLRRRKVMGLGHSVRWERG